MEDSSDSESHSIDEGIIKCSAKSCQKTDILYTNFPCKCLKYCKSCAMKLATGGKCKKCHQLFASMILIHNDD